MRSRWPFSVTDVPCKCGFLEKAADDSRWPIVFDDRTGEYQFRYRQGRGPGYSTLIIRHCPFCGGTAPESKRALLFHVIPPDEERRLSELLDGIGTIRGALRKLGKPEYDNPRGVLIEQPEHRGNAPRKQWRRMLTYSKLSSVADVLFTERSDGRASWLLQGKPRDTGQRVRRRK